MIGATACVNGDYAISLGSFSCATQNYAIAIGNQACSRFGNGIAIGNLSETKTNAPDVDHSQIAIGWCAKAQGGVSSIAIGAKANDTLGNGGITIGRGSCTTGSGGGSTIIGNESKTNKGGALVATGQIACAMDNYTAAVGGIFVEAHCLWSSVFAGGCSCACQCGSTVLGSCSLSTHKNAVVIGFEQVSKVANHVHVTNLVFSSPTGPFLDDAAFYTAGGTSGQAYISCLTGSNMLTIAGFN